MSGRFTVLHPINLRSNGSRPMLAVHPVVGSMAIGVLLQFCLTACTQDRTSAQSVPLPSVVVPTAEIVPSQPVAVPSSTHAAVPTIAAAGDIACAVNSSIEEHHQNSDLCRMEATSDLLVTSDLAAVLPLGDLQYEIGELDQFQRSYDPTWGRVKAITRPVVGNHEYATPGAAGYFSYFGEAAGELGKGYYSYDIGNWHLIALNSNCDSVGGCGEGSPQMQWLKADLAAHANQCTLAYWHHPRFSSGRHGNHESVSVFWQTLYDAGVEVVLNGHDHTYERFAPQTPDAVADPERGMRQFVVGTGGKNHYSFEDIQPNSEVRNADTYGVLMITLHPDRYVWQFKPIIGQSFIDSGETVCH